MILLRGHIHSVQRFRGGGYTISVSSRLCDADPAVLRVRKVAIGYFKGNNELVLVLGTSTLEGLPAHVTWLQIARWKQTASGTFRFYLGRHVCRIARLELPEGSFPVEAYRRKPYGDRWTIWFPLKNPLRPCRSYDKPIKA